MCNMTNYDRQIEDGASVFEYFMQYENEMRKERNIYRNMF